MAPKRKPRADTDETAADPDKNARLETYEQEVERASVESVAEHPEGSAPPLEVSLVERTLSGSFQRMYGLSQRRWKSLAASTASP